MFPLGGAGERVPLPPPPFIFAGTNFVFLEIRVLPPALLHFCEGLMYDGNQAGTEKESACTTMLRCRSHAQFAAGVGHR